MACREAGVGDRFLHWGREIEQADRVRDPGSAPPEAKRDRLVGEAERIGQARVCRGLLHRIEIGPQQVLGERHLELVPARFRGGSDDRRDARHARELGCSKAPLARHEAVRVAVALNDDRVQQAVQADRISKRRKGFGLEGSSRLFRVRRYRPRVKADQRGFFVGLGLVGEQRVEAAAETAPAERSRRGLLAHAGPGTPAAARPAPLRIRASRLALNSR